MKYFDVTRLLSGALEANGQRGTATAFVILLLSSGLPASAQSFFASNVTDPAAGVDRGSTSGIRKLDAPTAFLTFDTYGSEDIGPNILGLGYVQPDMAFSGDQLDVVGVIAGPSAEDSLELRAGGIGYRFPALGTRTEGIAYLSYANIALGTEANLAFDVSGTLSIGAVGIRHTAERENDAKLTSTAEVIARRATGTAFGTQVIDEDLRLLRVSTLYQQGLPNLFQRRFAAAVTVGLDALGASETSNGQASTPGATSEYLRASFSAETSIPLSEMWVANAGIIGQWSTDSLPVSQRCGYGTNSYARGFDQTYVLGDQCIGTRVEMAYNLQAPERTDTGFLFTQVYLGVDVGRLWNNANDVVPSRTDQWSSGSLGVRTIQGDFVGEAVLTHIFDKPTGVAPQERTRFWVRAGYRF